MAYLILLVLVSLCPSMAGMAASKIGSDWRHDPQIQESRGSQNPPGKLREEIASLVIERAFLWENHHVKQS